MAELKMVRLKDGSEVPSPAIPATMLALDELAKSSAGGDMLSFYELVTASRDPRHQIPAIYSSRLDDLGLMSAGVVHDVVAAVVRNAVSGTGPGMADWRIGTPLDLENQG